MGLAGGGFGPVAVTDARLLVPIPAGWSFAQAAAVPVAFTTAWYGLVDLAGVAAGAAAAGARGGRAGSGWRRWRSPGTWALEVFGTASPAKHGVLARPGPGRGAYRVLPDGGVRGSGSWPPPAGRDGYRAELAGRGADRRVAAAAAARAGRSWRWARPTCATPPRSPRTIPGVAYRAFDPAEAGPGPAGGDAGARSTALLAAGELAAAAGAGLGCAAGAGGVPVHEPGPAHRQDRADHPAGPGGPAGAGDGAGHRRDRDAGRPGGRAPGRRPGGRGGLVLASRSGPAAPGRAGAGRGPGRGRAPGCRWRRAMRRTGRRWPGCWPGSRRGCPLTGVVHAAGVLDDGVTGSLTPGAGGRGDAAEGGCGLAPARADRGRWTWRRSCCSPRRRRRSAAPGQGNYAAANAFLDGLAATGGRRGCPRCRWRGGCGPTPAG